MLPATPIFLLWLLVVLAGCSSGADSPASPSKAAGFGDPESCRPCHPTHVSEWEISPHAYAMVDPVFTAMVELGQRETEGELGNFCVECHSPIATFTGQGKVRETEDGFVQDLAGLDELAMAGVSCDVCHTMTRVERPVNAEFEMDPSGTRLGPIRSPVDNEFHESKPSSLHENSRLCGACHQVSGEMFSESVALERTFAEWLQSPFNGSQSCQDCHMVATRGRAAEGGPERQIHRHTFEGVDVSLVPPADFPGYDTLRESTETLLQNSAELGVSFDPATATLTVSIENLAGHALPSGATMDRQMWVELIIEDDAGEAIFESGTPDDNGDLRDDNPDHTTRPGSDPQLSLFRQLMYFDPALEGGDPTLPRRQVEFLWEPNVETNNLIGPNQTATRPYDLSDLPAGAHVARVRLLMRGFPPYMLRELEERAGLDPDVRQRLPTVVMEELELDVELL